MAFYIEATKNVLGKERKLYYVSPQCWTLDIEKKAIFENELMALGAKKRETIEGNIVSI